MENRVQIHIGDWSEDGHNQWETFVYEVNCPVEQIQQAYKDSCKKTGVQFNHNANYSGLKEHNSYGSERHIWTEYEERKFSPLSLQILKQNGLNVDKFELGEFEIEEAAILILEFIKLSLPSLTYIEASHKKSDLKTIPHLNGFWNKNLNVQFGYGLFY